jgi:hypothetical protein
MPRSGEAPGPSHPLVEEIHMKDAMGAPVLGGTKWKRFALVMVPTVGIAGGMTVMMAQGALATSIGFSGDMFKVSASTLHGTYFEQTGDVIVDSAGTPHAVAEAGIASADISDMCQSVKVGPLVVVLRAGGGGTPAHATDLVIDANQINADAVFTGVQIGVNAGDLQATGGVKGFTGAANHFGQLVQDALLTNVKQTAFSTTAGTFKLSGLSISANLGGTECFN